MEFAQPNKHGVYEDYQPGVERVGFVGTYWRCDIFLTRTEDGYFYRYDFALEDKRMFKVPFKNHDGSSPWNPLGMGKLECLGMAVKDVWKFIKPFAFYNPKAGVEILAWLDSLENPALEQMPLFGEGEA